MFSFSGVLRLGTWYVPKDYFLLLLTVPMLDEAVLRDASPAASEQLAPPEEDASKCPCTIITGFLGAGKTTLLRHVLTEPHGLKIAVIQNELSAVAGLEAATIKGANGEVFADWLELANGCVCCSVREELPLAIERLMEVKGRFDYVLIEARVSQLPMTLADDVPSHLSRPPPPPRPLLPPPHGSSTHLHLHNLPSLAPKSRASRRPGWRTQVRLRRRFGSMMSSSLRCVSTAS